jgi:hypothetical protein
MAEGIEGKMREIFVFGSNEAGRHGKGAALSARLNHGAVYGQGEGLQGDSYAIPTKDRNLGVRSIDEIASSVTTFLEFALSRPDLTFNVTPIGCGLAGYKPKDIAWMFDLPAPKNVNLPREFLEVLK